MVLIIKHWSTFENKFSEVLVLLTDSRLVFHTAFKYVSSFFRSDQFFYLFKF